MNKISLLVRIAFRQINSYRSYFKTNFYIIFYVSNLLHNSVSANIGISKFDIFENRFHRDLISQIYEVKDFE